MSSLESKLMFIGIICGALLAVMVLSESACAGECASLGCDDGSWDPMAKLDEIGTGKFEQSQSSPKWPEKSREIRWNMSPSDLESDGNNTAKANQGKPKADTDAQPNANKLQKMMIEIDEISKSDVLLDVSENATEHISGSLAIPYNEFMLNNSLKSVPEVAKILGQAGISQDDSLVIYGECLPCGGGPSASAYVYWMMKSLGHENVRVLNGYVQDWKERGLPTSSKAIVRPATNYTPAFTDQFIANYSFVKSDLPQVIDARTVQVFEAGSIPNAISIPYENVLNGTKIKSEYELEKSFSSLDKERPVIVFTNTGFTASIVWFALELMGFDAKLYSYKDWIINQAEEQKSGDLKK